MKTKTGLESVRTKVGLEYLRTKQGLESVDYCKEAVVENSSDIVVV